jgi:hypothetical protein
MRKSIAALSLATPLLIGCGAHGTPGVRDIAPRPLAAAEDPINVQADASVDALVLAFTIDGTTITLDQATLARVPRSSTRRSTELVGDRVSVIGYSAGNRVSDINVPDAVVKAQEGVGIVRTTRRQIRLALAAPRALDTIEVSAPATGATARLDVRVAYAPYCKEYNRDNKYCPAPVQR